MPSLTPLILATIDPNVDDSLAKVISRKVYNPASSLQREISRHAWQVDPSKAPTAGTAGQAKGISTEQVTQPDICVNTTRLDWSIVSQRIDFRI